jgi:large subunit ribosomal protein L30
MAKKVQITLKKSLIGRLPEQRKTVRSLGLRKIGSSVEQELSPSVEGMIRAVSHLVEVKEI